MATRETEQQASAGEVEALRRALARAEDRAGDLQDFLDNAVEGLHRVGPDGTILWANRAELEMLGYLREEYVGQQIARFHADPGVAVDIMDRLKRGESVMNRQSLMICRDGGYKFVLISASPVMRGGRFVSSRCFTRELTDERDAYIAQARLAAIVDGSDDAIVSKDLDGTVRSWNRGAQALFGYAPHEMVGDSILRIIPPHLHDEERTILARIAEGERVDHYETVRRHRDGRLIEVSLTVSPLRDMSGRVIGASKIGRAIGAQRDAERAQAVLAAIVHSSDDAIISKNLDSVVTSWNPAAERLYGWSAKEIVGKPILMIIPPELRMEEDYILGEIRAGRHITHFETERMRKDGSRVQVSITVSPVRGPGGRIVGASKIARDVTQQRDAQRKKDQFLAVLAHELRNPLAPIRNTLALVRDGTLPAVHRERAVEMAERQMVHLTRLLDDLLDVSRMTTGRVELKCARVDLAEIARQAADAAQPHVQARKHSFTAHVPSEPLWIDADAVRIGQVIGNLLANASKYTDPGGNISLTVEREGDSAWIRVRDDGIGFLPRMRDRLFTLFEQDEAAASRAAGGLGIGLALVREFVERHQGSVDAASEGTGKGSVFSVRLPLVL